MAIGKQVAPSTENISLYFLLVSVSFVRFRETLRFAGTVHSILRSTQQFSFCFVAAVTRARAHCGNEIPTLRKLTTVRFYTDDTLTCGVLVVSGRRHCAEAGCQR